MNVKLTAEIHREGEWYAGFCQEVPEANGQGHSAEECFYSLKEAVLLLMEDRREDANRKLAEGPMCLNSREGVGTRLASRRPWPSAQA